MIVDRSYMKTQLMALLVLATAAIEHVPPDALRSVGRRDTTAGDGQGIRPGSDAAPRARGSSSRASSAVPGTIDTLDNRVTHIAGNDIGATPGDGDFPRGVPPPKKREGAAVESPEESKGNAVSSKIPENARTILQVNSTGKGEEVASNVMKAKKNDKNGGEGRMEEHGETPRPEKFSLPPHVAGTNGMVGVSRCQQPPETGPCRASFLMWAYNASSGTCVTFTYGGCLGNENNFKTEHQCSAACPDEVPCPDDASKVCRVSETSCRNASCPGDELAACRVTPCTCDVSFVSEDGEEVDCHKAVDAADGPEGRGSDIDLADGSGGMKPTEASRAGDSGDGGAREKDNLERDKAKDKAMVDEEEDVYQQPGLWIGVSVGVILLLAGAVIAFYKWRGNNRSYAIFLLTSAEDFSPCEGDGSKFTEYSSITA